jgi:hypothetical protein
MTNPQTYLVIADDGAQYGPIPESDLRAWIQDRRVNGQNQAWQEGSADWKPLSEHAAFRGLFAPPPLPAPMPRRPAAPPPAPPPRAARPGAGKQPSAKMKQRARWWIVSTHVLTAGFAMPLLAGIVAGLLCGLLELQGVTAYILFGIMGALGYIGGTFYSLSYLKKKATTPNWSACTAPAIVWFAVIQLLTLVAFAFQNSGSPPAILIWLLFNGSSFAVFAKITAKGFRDLEE